MTGPGGTGDEVVMFNGAAVMVMEKTVVEVPGVGVAESVTVTEMLFVVPETLGAPLRVPPEDRLKPAGRPVAFQL